MIYYTIQPPVPLAPYVRCFWVLEHTVSEQQSYFHRSMADGCAELLFHYKGIFDELYRNGKQERSFTSGLDGPSRQFARYHINESFGIFGAYLYPFALQKFFNIPACALSDQSPDLHSLLGQAGKDLEEKIILAAGNTERVNILSQFLQAALTRHTTPHKNIFAAIAYIIQNKGTIQVEELAGQCCLSTRQFERNFKQWAGFTPKLYSRIIRFQSALNEYGNKHKTLTQIAYDCGYYDQSHFIHDFKEFSGFHPKEYFKGNPEGTGWRDA